MENLTSLALAKFKLDKTVRGEILPGVYDVDIDISVKGTVTVGEDYDQNITASVKWQKLLLLALSKMNDVTVESLVRELDEKNDVSDEQEKAIKAQAEKALLAITGKTKKTCKGKVTSKLTFAENVTA